MPSNRTDSKKRKNGAGKGRQSSFFFFCLLSWDRSVEREPSSFSFPHVSFFSPSRRVDVPDWNLSTGSRRDARSGRDAITHTYTAKLKRRERQRGRGKTGLCWPPTRPSFCMYVQQQQLARSLLHNAQRSLLLPVTKTFPSINVCRSYPLSNQARERKKTYPSASAPLNALS